MKRAVICVRDPENYIPRYRDYSLMVVNPDSSPARLDYLLGNADWSLLVTENSEQTRDGGDYGDERLLWYTSGTTGDSKFRSFTQEQLDAQCRTICHAYELTDNDRYLNVMPLWHAHGQGMYWASQHAKCEIKYAKLGDLTRPVKYSPTFVSAIPDFLNLLTHQDFKDLRFVRSASSALPDTLYRKLTEWSFTSVIEAFGMTEALSHCFTNPLYGQLRPGTVGLPSGIEAKIDNGVLYIRGRSVFCDGWFNTGDYADQDRMGYYRILGRVVDRLNIKGYKIDPLSIENQLLNQLPDLGEVAVFGNDRVMCVYTGNVDEQLVRRTLINIDAHCNPKFLQRVDIIPNNTAGKVSRTFLKDYYA